MGPLIAAEWIDHSRPPVPPPTRGVTVEYGRYLGRIASCHGGHRPDLAGGGGPPPRATNLTSAALRAWSEDDFIRAMRFGARPDGTHIMSAEGRCRTTSSGRSGDTFDRHLTTL